MVSPNVYAVFPPCLSPMIANLLYAHAQTVNVFSLATKNLGTRLDTSTVVKGQILKFWIHNPGRIVTELKVCFYKYTQSDV